MENKKEQVFFSLPTLGTNLNIDVKILILWRKRDTEDASLLIVLIATKMKLIILHRNQAICLWEIAELPAQYQSTVVGYFNYQQLSVENNYAPDYKPQQIYLGHFREYGRNWEKKRRDIKGVKL